MLPGGKTAATAKEEARLVDPRTILAETELQVEIAQGQKQKHANLLSVSKPAEPNHYKWTASLAKRYEVAPFSLAPCAARSSPREVREIEPRLTGEDREELAQTLEERARLRPPMPPMLSAEDREENRQILRRMQTKVSNLGETNSSYV